MDPKHLKNQEQWVGGEVLAADRELVELAADKIYPNEWFIAAVLLSSLCIRNDSLEPLEDVPSRDSRTAP